MATYQHNALGQRVLKSLPGARAFHYDRKGRLLQEYTTPVTTVPVAHIWLGDLPLATEQSGNLYYTHPDHRGTTLRITDSAQALKWDAILTPFGETHSLPAQALTYSVRLPGQFHDGEGNTGWHYNYRRTFDSSLGRYIQSDPIGLRGGLNTYAYVGSDPLSFIDADGLGRVGYIVELTKTGMNKLRSLFDKADAIAARRAEKNVLLEKGTKQEAKAIEKAARDNPGQPVQTHSGHDLGDGAVGRSHAQTDGRRGHTFYDAAGIAAAGAAALDFLLKLIDELDPLKIGSTSACDTIDCLGPPSPSAIQEQPPAPPIEIPPGDYCLSP